ncbi:Angiotensin-converting enzyme [Orchesella cincta]|uniref:Angiotensin-converting enzyme n=1 Tax=Orchesella cincta TaxID=48709 RepID=A0A1D2NJ96_ORCCI|nr:Angiotensin-converting enzyme [Orchesella cincta]
MTTGLEQTENQVLEQTENTEVLSKDEDSAKKLLDKLEQEVHAECQNRAMKEWLYATNLTSENRKAAAESAVSYSRFWKNTWDSIRKYDWRSFKDPIIQRQFKLLSVLGMSILPEEKLRKYNAVKQAMESTYSVAKICSYQERSRCNLTLEPGKPTVLFVEVVSSIAIISLSVLNNVMSHTELSEIFKQSHDPEELKYYWTQWRDLSGKKMRNNFTDMVAIMDLAAKMNNFSDAAEYDVRSYNSPTFRDDIEKIWQQMKPFYEQLHAYVRFKLRKYYGESIVPKKRPIPAHLLGNMWAQTWENVYDLVIPYPNKSAIDVTTKMVEKKLRAHDLAKMAEDFFISLDLSPMPPEFWNGSILEKPIDREIICHARDGANPGFHEAIGDLISISVQTPQHLHAIGLLETVEHDYEADINYLLRTALTKIAFLPYGYLMDLWRWDVYTGKTSSDDLNCNWWKLREKYQGVNPPVQRSEDDFDPGSKFHVASNVAYIRYFVSMILQFQFHESLCIAAGEMHPVFGQGKPLYKCDIYKSKEAGEKLGAMLQMGASRPWEDAMEAITGQRTMDAKAMLDYFDPLMKWLANQNKKNGEFVGWLPSDDVSCIKTPHHASMPVPTGDLNEATLPSTSTTEPPQSPSYSSTTNVLNSSYSLHNGCCIITWYVFTA